MSLFQAADILLPNVRDMGLWPVVACDQFTSQPEYWDEVREKVGDAPSSYHLILPEAELPASPERTAAIHATMKDYLEKGLFREHKNAYVYVERTQMDGSVRRGVVGAVDLEGYDYSEGSSSPIRATERTVVERIPPRRAVREGAPLELPHVLMLCDDAEQTLIEPIAQKKGQLPQLYSVDLMLGGGHVSGWLVQGGEAGLLDRRLDSYIQSHASLPFAVGDGNHSLATAKACYEAMKQAHPAQDFSRHPARYVLVELENIHDPALRFEPVHRLVKGANVPRLLERLTADCGAEEGYPVEWFSGSHGPSGGDGSGTIRLDRSRASLALGVLQSWLDEYLAHNPGETDYIHGEDVLKRLAAEKDSVGFLLPPIDKGQFFRWIVSEGVLPRKTFSMGHAQEKRYYLEGRRITD
ncbi:MAG: DUF1015 domain-containing protein [Fretibacterium sp.]|nr:DUF1015 domain-containing protein [Fretibacterium sp.]